MSTEIKNTLFRFATVRAPELLDEKGKTLLFTVKLKTSFYEKIASPI